jgi:RNA polymerase sigma factor (sigma-70 family)
MLGSREPISIRPTIALDRGPALAPALSPRGAVPAEIDAQLGTLARRAANGDRAARNALYAAFAPRLDHWIRRSQGSCRRYGVDLAIESEDVAQEAFVVFADLLAAWNGRGSLSAYVIAYFPWRLSNAIRKLSDSRECRSLDAVPTDFLADGTVAAEEATALLEALAAELPEREGNVLLLRIRDRCTWPEIANRLGIDKRTAMRDLKRVLAGLRASMGSAP